MTTVSTPPTFPAIGSATFNMDAYAWATFMAATYTPQLNIVAGEVNINASNAAASESAAAASEGAAATSVTDAGNAAAAAAASAATAASAPGTSATSTTSLTVGVGSQSLTIDTGKSIVVGMTVKIANTASPGNWMLGDVTAYTSGTGALVVNVTATNGSGTFTAWTVSLSSPIAPVVKYTQADKTGAYSVVAGDLGAIIRTTSGTGAITLPSCAAVGVGFWFTYTNATNAAITLQRVGSDKLQNSGNSIGVSPHSTITIAVENASASGVWRILSRSATGEAANTVSFGSAAAASGSNSVAIGSTATASATESIAIGLNSTASAADAIAIGIGVQATAAFAMAFGSGVSNIIGKIAYGGYGGAVSTQMGAFNLRVAASAISTNYVLTTDGNAAAATNQIVVPINSAFSFSGTVVARQKTSVGSNAAAWSVTGMARREAGNIVLVGTPAVTSISGTVPTGWTLTCTADTANQAVALTYNMGTTAMTGVQVASNIKTAELTYA